MVVPSYCSLVKLMLFVTTIVYTVEIILTNFISQLRGTAQKNNQYQDKN